MTDYEMYGNQVPVRAFRMSATSRYSMTNFEYDNNENFNFSTKDQMIQKTQIVIILI